jgi:hypothetical protein
MRMTASWSGSDRTYRIQVGGAKMRPNGKLPSNHHSDRRRQTLELRRKARLPPVHPPFACSGVKALRNTSLAKAASRQAALAFRSLDPFRALREPDRRRRDGERPSRSEQRTLSKNQKQRLDRKSPIQVRIPFPPAASLLRTDRQVGEAECLKPWAYRGRSGAERANGQPPPRSYGLFRRTAKIPVAQDGRSVSVRDRESGSTGSATHLKLRAVVLRRNIGGEAVAWGHRKPPSTRRRYHEAHRGVTSWYARDA